MFLLLFRLLHVNLRGRLHRAGRKALLRVDVPMQQRVGVHGRIASS
jgi:hypothetical protein